jgi:hypothetical protein
MVTILLSAAASAVMTLVVNYFGRRQEHQLRIDSETKIRERDHALRKKVERGLKLHEAELRVMVEHAVQKARAEVERDLKTHEIRLRVAADLRLKLTDRVLNDVGQYRTKLTAAFNSIYLITQEAEPRGKTPRLEELVEDARRAFAAVPTSGPFVPPELLDSAVILVEEAHNCFRSVVEWAVLPTRPERTARCLETNAKIEEIGDRARLLFGDWQRKEFAVLRTGVDELRLSADSTKG